MAFQNRNNLNSPCDIIRPLEFPRDILGEAGKANEKVAAELEAAMERKKKKNCKKGGERERIWIKGVSLAKLCYHVKSWSGEMLFLFDDLIQCYTSLIYSIWTSSIQGNTPLTIQSNTHISLVRQFHVNHQDYSEQQWRGSSDFLMKWRIELDKISL